jgi:hypothetical protein
MLGCDHPAIILFWATITPAITLLSPLRSGAITLRSPCVRSPLIPPSRIVGRLGALGDLPSRSGAFLKAIFPSCDSVQIVNVSQGQVFRPETAAPAFCAQGCRARRGAG